MVGGTGPLGRGLALRFALAGHGVVIGSRAAARAQEVADGVRAAVPDRVVEVSGATNAGAAQADVVVLALPYAAQAATLPALADLLAGKVVVSCANHLGFDAAGPHPKAVLAGSAAGEVAQLLPRARVVGGFQNVSAAALRRAPSPVDADVLITGDDEEAKQVVHDLVGSVHGLRGVDAGPLRLSAAVEQLTAVLIAVNRRYGATTGIRVTGLPGGLP